MCNNDPIQFATHSFNFLNVYYYLFPFITVKAEENGKIKKRLKKMQKRKVKTLIMVLHTLKTALSLSEILHCSHC